MCKETYLIIYQTRYQEWRKKLIHRNKQFICCNCGTNMVSDNNIKPSHCISCSARFVKSFNRNNSNVIKGVDRLIRLEKLKEIGLDERNIST